MTRLRPQSVVWTALRLNPSQSTATAAIRVALNTVLAYACFQPRIPFVVERLSRSRKPQPEATVQAAPACGNCTSLRTHAVRMPPGGFLHTAYTSLLEALGFIAYRCESCDAVTMAFEWRPQSGARKAQREHIIAQHKAFINEITVTRRMLQTYPDLVIHNQAVERI